MLSFEECQEMGKRIREEEKKRNERIENIRKEELRKQGIDPDAYKNVKPQYDSPYALENGPATILWLVVAIGALIFKDGWMISVIATFVWLKYITRHIDVDGGNQ
jgi:hypothetical protein